MMADSARGEPVIMMNTSASVESGVSGDSFIFFSKTSGELCSNYDRKSVSADAESVEMELEGAGVTRYGEEFSSLFKMKTISDAEDHDLRKKRCADRYDSSESSDSGVATLSCSDSSGSSSSDITDPGSPLSSSSSCECSESPTPPKMPPNSAFPWNKRPASPASEHDLIDSFHLKRLKVGEDPDTDTDTDSVLNNNNSLDTEDEFKKLVKCCIRNGTTLPESQVRKALFAEHPELPLPQISKNTDAKLVLNSGSNFLQSGAEAPDSSLSESASNGASPEEADRPTASLSIPADILSKTLVVKCENLSSLTQAQMPVSVFQLENPARLISDPKSDTPKPKCANGKVTSVQFRVPQTRRKLRSSRSSALNSGLSGIPESSTNPFAFSRNFPGAYLLSPTVVNGHVVKELPEIPLVPGGLSRFSSTGSIRKLAEPTDQVTSYLTLRGVVSVPVPDRNGTAQAKTDPEPDLVKSKESEDSTHRLPLSIYRQSSEEKTESSCSSLEFSDSSNSCQDSSASNFTEDSASREASQNPILAAPKNIRFPKQTDKTPDDRYFQEEIVCRWKDCSADFSSNAALVEHLQTKHVKEETEGEMSSCFWEGCKCYGKPATNKGYLENHVITHAGKKPFSCIFQRCGLSFSSQGALARHVTQHFTDDDGNSAAKKTPDSPQCKPNKRKVRKLRCRKRPQSRVTDFFDSSALERLNEKFATDTLRRTQGIFNENDNGFSITLLSQVCAKRTEPNGTVRYLLRWFPRGIVEEEWLTMDKIRGHRFVDMRTLAEEERQTCLKYIFQGGAVPAKSSRKLNQNS